MNINTICWVAPPYWQIVLLPLSWRGKCMLLPSHCARVFHQMDQRNTTLLFFLRFPPRNWLGSVFLVKVAQLFSLLLNESNILPRMKTENEPLCWRDDGVALWVNKTYGVFHHEKSLIVCGASSARVSWACFCFLPHSQRLPVRCVGFCAQCR